MPKLQPRKKKKNFYTIGWQKNWVWQHHFLKHWWVPFLRQNPIHPHLYTRTSSTQVRKIFFIAYWNCNSINAVLFVWGNGGFCEFRILPKTKIIKNMIFVSNYFGFVSSVVKKQRTKSPEEEKCADVELELKRDQMSVTHQGSRWEQNQNLCVIWEVLIGLNYQRTTEGL